MPRIILPSGEKDDFGTIRIRARLTEERILPTEYYQPLLKVLMDSVSPEIVSLLLKYMHTIPFDVPYKLPDNNNNMFPVLWALLTECSVRLFLAQSDRTNSPEDAARSDDPRPSGASEHAG